MIKKGILLTLCVLVAGMARADEDWLVRRLKTYNKSSNDWLCSHFEKTATENAQKEETVELSENKSASDVDKMPSKPKIEATMKKPEVVVEKTQPGDTIVDEFEELTEKDWLVRRINLCENDENDWTCRHYKQALQEARDGKIRAYKEHLEEKERRKQEEEQKRLALLAEANKQREKARLEDLERQKKLAEEAELQRIKRENELRKKAEDIIKRRVEEAKTYKKISSGEERQQEDRILAEYYQIKLKYKSEGLEEKINWLEQSKKDL